MSDPQWNTGSAPPSQSFLYSSFGLADLVQVFLRHRLLFSVLTVFSLATVWYEHKYYPNYSASSKLVFELPNSNPIQAVSARLGVFDKNMEDTTMTSALRTLESHRFSVRVLEEFKKREDYHWRTEQVFSDKGKMLNHLKKIIFLGRVKRKAINYSDDEVLAGLKALVQYKVLGKDSLRISVSSAHADLSVLLANLYAVVAKDIVVESKSQELSEARDFLNVEIERAEEEIKHIENEIILFKKKNKVVSMNKAQSYSSKRIDKMRTELAEITVRIKQNEKLVVSLGTDLREQRKRVPASEWKKSSDLDPNYKFGISKKIEKVKKSIDYLRMRKATLQKILDETLRSTSQNAEHRVFDLRKRIQLQYTLFEELKKQLFQLEMSQISTRNKVRVMERARASDVTRSEKFIVKALMAVLLALILGASIAYAGELSAPTIRSRKDLIANHLEFLGSIPDLSVVRHRRTFRRPFTVVRKVEKPDEICRFDLDSAGSMAFIQLRSRIMQLSEFHDVNTQVISILSARSGEGKSMISRNLAASFGHAKKKTLLLDCDLRNFGTSAFFQSEDYVGLSDILSSDEKFGSAVLRDVVKNVDLLPAGLVKSDITEMLAGEDFSQLLSDLKMVYDRIIIDTPSMTCAPDSAFLAKMSDISLFVGLFNYTTFRSIEQALDTISGIDDKKLYGVLNKVTGDREHLYVVPKSQLIRQKELVSGGGRA